MKKQLLTLIFALTIFFAYSQCSPDPQYTAPGIYPDSTTGLADATVNQPYSQVITVITPLDTNVDINGIPIDVTVQTIEVTSVTGLPPNFTYTCLVPDCIFPGGSTSCAILTSTSDPTLADVGTYQIIFNTTTTVDAGIGLPITQDDVIDYYYLDILGPTSVINYVEKSSFELKDIYPNPTSNNVKIQFVLGFSDNIEFKINNIYGQEIYSSYLKADRGVNTINYNTSSLADGIYFYSISNGIQTKTKKMIIKN